MLRALVVLTGLMASLASAAVLVDNGMPILWAQTAGQLTDLPNQSGVLTPNPWNYVQRMSLYRLLIAATSPYMGMMGTQLTDSPVWGLPLQLAWELTSGRLADPTGASTCGQQTGDPMCIATESWWGCVNYYFSVLPFLSAAQQGLLGEGVQVQMQVPEGIVDYCTNYTDCATHFPGVMTSWDAFYQGLKAASDSPLSDLEKKDQILGLYWAAHQKSMASSAGCAARKSHYSSAEVSFANSWVNSAEYIAVTHFQSDMQKSLLFMTPLPSRILKEGDRAPNIADLSQEENHTLSVFSWMKSVDSLLGGSLVGMWRRAMCSVGTREKGRALLDQLFLKPSFATPTLILHISKMAASC